jgi:hypothetical protein
LVSCVAFAEGDGCIPLILSVFFTISTASTVAGWGGELSYGRVPLLPEAMGRLEEKAVPLPGLGENIKMEALIITTRKTPTEIATSNSFFFSINNNLHQQSAGT